SAGNRFTGLKTEASKVPDGPQPFSLVSRQRSLTGILDHGQIVLVRDFHYPLHIARHAKYVNGHDGFGVGGDLPLYVVRIQLVSVWLHISQHRKRVATQYGSYRSKIGIRRGNDFISVPDLQRIHAGAQSLGSGTCTY